MRFGITVPNFGRFGDPREAARLAANAETAGWDGYFIWDVYSFMIGSRPPSFDPWIVLTAAVLATDRLIVGTTIAVVPRYRPHVLALTLANLDVLSGGRFVFGVGLGVSDEEYSAFGEEPDLPERAAKLDESLQVITRLWSGDEVTHNGRHYTVNKVTLAPVPVQTPRIPIWIGGDSRPALRRAARWDGWIGPTDPWKQGWAPDDLAHFVERIGRERQAEALGEIAWAGFSTPDDGELVDAYGKAGATWWIEVVDGSRGSFEEMQERVAAGPPS